MRGETKMSEKKSLLVDKSKMPLAVGVAFVAFTTQFGGGFASFDIGYGQCYIFTRLKYLVEKSHICYKHRCTQHPITYYKHSRITYDSYNDSRTHHLA